MKYSKGDLVYLFYGGKDFYRNIYIIEIMRMEKRYDGKIAFGGLIKYCDKHPQCIGEISGVGGDAGYFLYDYYNIYKANISIKDILLMESL